MMEKENHHLSVPTFMMVVGNNQTLMLKLVDRRTLRNRVFAAAPLTERSKLISPMMRQGDIILLLT